MNGRLYDPVLGRMLSPDPYIMGTDNTQGYNRYTYALNNPLKFTDPSGEVVWAPLIIGAVVGAYMGGTMSNGNYNPTKWNFNSGRTWGWMAGGAIVGAASGFVGGAVAASGMPMANTMGIVSSSFVNSLGTAMYTGGQTSVSVSFGIGSYDFNSGSLRGLWNSKLSTLEKIGYGFGALANLQDVVAGFHGTVNETRAEHGDGILHSRSRGKYVDEKGITQNYDISVSHVNSGVYKYNGDNGLLGNLDYARYWGTHLDDGIYYASTSVGWKATLYNVNSKIMGRMYENISGKIPKSLWGFNSLKYGTTVSGCYGHVARSLLSVGVPTIPFYGFTPHGLVLQLWARQAGIWASPILINR